MRNLIGLPVSDVLAHFGFDYGALDFIDEPPGQLRAVRLDRSATGEATITLDLAGDPLPFSFECEWPESEVLGRTVARVHRADDAGGTDRHGSRP